MNLELRLHSLLSQKTWLGSSPTRGTCETKQVLLAGVTGVFFSGFLVFFTPPTDWPVSYELK